MEFEDIMEFEDLSTLLKDKLLDMYKENSNNVTIALSYIQTIDTLHLIQRKLYAALLKFIQENF